MSEFNLSDRIEKGECPVPECNCFHRDEYLWLKTIDVKEFIRRFKGIIETWHMPNCSFPLLLNEIDKLAGDKLI